MKAIYKVLLLAFIILGTKNTYSQQDPMYSQYVFNGLVINPAYAGTHETMSASALYRNQWVGLPGAPKTGIFTIDAPLKNQKVGVGLNVIYDKIGIYSQTGITGIYSYKLKFENSTLSLGLQIGIGFNTSNFSTVKYSENTASSDEAFSLNYHQTSPDFGFGAYYYTNHFYAGFSIPEISAKGLFNTITNNSNLKVIDQVSHYFLGSGYIFDINKDMKIIPSTLIKIVKGSPLEADLNGTLWFYDILALGISYRSLASANFYAEIKISKQLLLGYAFEYSTNALSSFNQGSHEIMLQYLFDFAKSKIVTPRYF
jgi:type IX secretion system PorP/SprF family membrane protein